MAAVGFDLGNLNSVIAAARGKGVDILLNEFSSRINPGIVYLDTVRIIGEAAKAPSISRYQNTITQFKRLIGCKYKDDFVQRELKNVYYKHCELSNGGIGIYLNYQEKEVLFTVEQIMAMFLTKLKHVTEEDMKKPLQTLVVSCPVWFTNAQRIALRECCEIAGLPCSRIINDTTAVALAYGIYQLNLPEKDPLKIVFINIGHSNLQVSVVSFLKDQMKILGSFFDEDLGGRNFDHRLLLHFSNIFKSKTNINLFDRPRNLLRLLEECEKLKKMMSANSNYVPLNIECLCEDNDFRDGMERSQFEELCQDLFQKVENCFNKVFEILKPEEISSIEIVGGSSRIPAIKALVQKVFGIPFSTSLNADECVAKGCAWQAAFCSPLHRPREYTFTESSVYGIDLLWQSKNEKNEPIQVRKSIIESNQSINNSKMLTFKKSEPFEIIAAYSDSSKNPCHQESIGKWLILNNQTPAEGVESTVKVRLRMNNDGVFLVSDAHTVEEILISDEEKSEIKTENKTDEHPNESSNSINIKEPVKMKKKLIKKDLEVQNLMIPYSNETLKQYQQYEKEMDHHDIEEKLRTIAKNNLEELLYEFKDKMENAFVPFVDPSKIAIISEILDNTLNWLYNEGDNCEKALYLEKIQSIKDYYDPTFYRFQQSDLRSKASVEFVSLIKKIKEVIKLYSQGNDKYAHLTQEEVEKIATLVEAKENWFVNAVADQNKLSQYETPKLVSDLIYANLKDLTDCVQPIINKPKPAPHVEADKPKDAQPEQTETPLNPNLFSNNNEQINSKV